jgi:hypothetical protein
MFIYKGEEYPRYLKKEQDYEVIEVLIPEPTGDYFLAIIDSSGGYLIKEFVSNGDVELSLDR